MTEQTRTQDRVTLRFLANPGDAEADGATVQAGSVLESIDKAGYACAVGWAETACVTAYVGNVNFDRPIASGDLVEVRARIIHTGRSSIHVHVMVLSADARHGDFQLATHCLLVFVAVDASGRPQPVPPWQPRLLDDLVFSEGVESRIEARARIRDEVRRQTYTDAGTAPRVTFRFLASPSVVNFGGNAHGGTVMRWIDEAARTCASRWAKRPTVAAYTGGIHFFSPIHIGDVVEVEARLLHTGPRSLHIAVHVRSGDPTGTELRSTTQCTSILVVRGDDGRAQPIVPFVPVTQEDEELDAHAVRLILMRSALAQMPVE